MKPDLSKLRDIHLPDPVSWWPPAPGWWLLAALIVIAFATAYLIFRRRRRDRWRHTALEELGRLRGGTGQQFLGGVSVLLRRVAVTRFPRHEVAALTGVDWLAFLDRTLGDGTPFQSGSGRILASGPYTDTADVDTAALLALCERWIKRLPAGGAR
jgi:Domain of unknown function (DUF4381)